MKEPSAFRALFDLARAGNFPSVASNVLAALVLSSETATIFPAWSLFALATLAGCLVYAGGASFNDVFDAGFDARHRPERVIPLGIISRRSAGIVAAFEMLLGLALLVYLGAFPRWVLELAVTILVYDWLHKRWIGSVVLMAGCRVFLALAVASIVSPKLLTTPFLGWVSALFIYIVALSLIARWEYKPGAPAAKIGRSVGRLLAFIPLIDAIALLLVGAWLPALACALAVPLGRLAQRLAAST
ncbi:MAG: UbiA family prenyltransferase [Verrucomicrobiota bacterium]